MAFVVNTGIAGVARTGCDARLESLPAKGYGVAVVPQRPVQDRVDWILARVFPAGERA